MKRFLAVLKGDIRYQWRYGFYFIYMFMTAVFIVIVQLLPGQWRQTALTLTLLSDPVLLGFFFIGGILQLERGEGLLDALFLSPLRPREYLLSKALSLSLIATAAGTAVALGSGVPGVRWALLIPVMLFGSACFTFAGVAISVNLRSTNAFLSVDGLWEVILLLPPLLLVFGIEIPLLEAMPGAIVLRLMQVSAGADMPIALTAALLTAWTAAAYCLAHVRLNSALSKLGGSAT